MQQNIFDIFTRDTMAKYKKNYFSFNMKVCFAKIK